MRKPEDSERKRRKEGENKGQRRLNFFGEDVEGTSFDAGRRMSAREEKKVQGRPAKKDSRKGAGGHLGIM